MFSQTQFASRMAAEEAIPNQGDGHLRWHAKRSADVFRAFKGMGFNYTAGQICVFRLSAPFKPRACTADS